MKAVDVHSDWGYWDRLDGSHLKDGERLRVQWPDGTVTDEVCRIEHRTLSVSDHGHPYQTTDDRAFVGVQWHGADCKVYLRQDGVLCERL